MLDHLNPELSLDNLPASLRSTVQRMEQSENPAVFLFIKNILLERIAELEIEAKETPLVGSFVTQITPCEEN
jgi:hypothetical protein